MEGAPTIVDALRLHADRQPERPALVFLADGEREQARWSYAGLGRPARSVAAALRARGVEPSDGVLLAFPPGLEFAAAFFGCLYAGAIAVPVPPPHPRRVE